uniref:Secreted protein n=1 Tax=Anguilla anguilla TaxID=7936 RepID=A0A0E9P698_ANGAN
MSNVACVLLLLEVLAHLFLGVSTSNHLPPSQSPRSVVVQLTQRFFLNVGDNSCQFSRFGCEVKLLGESDPPPNSFFSFQRRSVSVTEDKNTPSK